MAVDITNVITYKRLVAAGNSKVFFEDIGVTAGSLIELAASSGGVDTTDQLTMASAFQKVFIANGSNLKVADFINTRLTVTGMTTAPTRGAVVTQAGVGGATMIVDYVPTGNEAIYGYVTSGTFDTVSSLSGGGMTSVTPSAVAGVLTHAVLTTAHTAADVLTQATTGAKMTVEYTDATKTHTYGKITTGIFNTTNQVTGSGTGTAFTPTAVSTRPPLWYNWTVYPGETSGTMPTKAYLITAYRGRLVLSGNPIYPNQWYMSKIGNPWDWLYGADDPMSAVAGNNADAGQCPDIPRALIAFHDDYLIYGCSSTIWILRGDPVAGGSLDSLSDDTGIFGANSYCFDDNRNMYFWGTGGIYKLTQDLSNLDCISKVALPDLINDEAANPSTHAITLCYDRKRYGVLITVTILATGVNSNYFYSLKTNGFYPESYPKQCGVYSMYYYAANNTALAELLLGSMDGRIRVFDELATDDDIGGTDEAIPSYVTYPITPLSELDENGKLVEMVFDLSGGAAGGTFGDTDAVTYSLFKGDDAETVLEDIKDEATAFTTGTLTGTGRKNKIRPRMRGAYMGLKLSNTTAAQTWSINRVLFDTRKAGKV